MENAPLNLAHFHERRAEKLIKRHNYDEAIAYLEKSIFYVSEAYKYSQMPVSAKILDAQNWDYKRKIVQLKLQKVNEGIQSIDETQFSEENNFKSIPGIKSSIDETLEDIDMKYKSYIEAKNCDTSGYESNPKQNVINYNRDEEDWLRVIESNDCLAPLELPMFEFDAFKTRSSDYMNLSNICSNRKETNEK